MLDERLRWDAFWALDALKGGTVRNYYEQIRDSYRYGTSIAKTREKIQKLIAHAVRTTDFYKDFDENTTLQQLPVVNKETFRNHYAAFLSSEFKDAPDNRITVSYTHLTLPTKA